jgi:protein disulfide-isomerase A6
MSLGARLLGLLAVAAANEPLYDFESSPLIKLDDSNFDKEVVKDDGHLWVVEFYADWCGHCKQFAKGYQKAATNLEGIVKFGAVNADTQKKTASAAGVQGFPSVKLYVPGSGQKNPYTGKFFKPALDYSGPRTAKGVVEFATASLPSLVAPVTDKTLAKFKSNGTSALPKALLFTKKEETTPLLKALSLSLKGRMLLGEAKDTAKKAAEEFGVVDYPTLYVLPAGEGSTPAKYDGELKPAALTAFLASHALEKALPGANDGAEGKDGKGKGAGGAGGAGGDSNVVEITSANVAELVEGERDAWVLLFPGTDDSELPGGGLEGLGEQLLGQAKVGKAPKELAGKFGIKELASGPTLAVWPFRKAGVKRKAVSFKGTEDGLANAKKAALDTLPDEYVTQVNSANADRWMQEAMMTSEAKAFAILFSDKPVVPPLFR